MMRNNVLVCSGKENTDPTGKLVDFLANLCPCPHLWPRATGEWSFWAPLELSYLKAAQSRAAARPNQKKTSGLELGCRCHVKPSRDPIIEPVLVLVTKTQRYLLDNLHVKPGEDPREKPGRL